MGPDVMRSVKKLLPDVMANMPVLLYQVRRQLLVQALT